ncbi:MAG: carboxymuconolactone decarboxylase family protein [Pseudomonadota bacterium]
MEPAGELLFGECAFDIERGELKRNGQPVRLTSGELALLGTYLDVSGLLSKTSLTPTEQQVVLLSASYENECHYCMAAHTTVAKGAGVAADVLEAIRAGQPIDDAKLEALRRFTALVTVNRGWVDEAEVEALLAAGYDRRTILDVILGVSLKTISNYVNHFADTPVDDAFAANAWTPPGKEAAA